MFFKQIVFPSKSIIEIKSDLKFWFDTVTFVASGIKKIRLMVECPVCNISYQLRENVPNEEIMKDAIKINNVFYFKHIVSHCPKCNTGNPPTTVFNNEYCDFTCGS